MTRKHPMKNFLETIKTVTGVFPQPVWLACCKVAFTILSTPINLIIKSLKTLQSSKDKLNILVQIFQIINMPYGQNLRTFSV